MADMRERLIELRKFFQMSQKEFGERVGMSQSTYSPLENGREIRDAYVKLICQAYHVSEDWLRHGIPPMLSDDRDRELDELMSLYDRLPPVLQKFLLKQARDLRDLHEEQSSRAD